MFVKKVVIAYTSLPEFAKMFHDHGIAEGSYTRRSAQTAYSETTTLT